LSIKAFAWAAIVTGPALAVSPAWAQSQPGAAPPATPSITAPRAPSAAPTDAPYAVINRQLTVAAIQAMAVRSADGTKVGAIERVVENNADKKLYVLIERGGFLGIGAKKVAIPLENVAVHNNGKLIIRNMPDTQIDAAPEFRDDDNAFSELAGNRTVSVPQA
jgi:hypothetical protein